MQTGYHPRRPLCVNGADDVVGLSKALSHGGCGLDHPLRLTVLAVTTYAVLASIAAITSSRH